MINGEEYDNLFFIIFLLIVGEKYDNFFFFFFVFLEDWKEGNKEEMPYGNGNE